MLEAEQAAIGAALLHGPSHLPTGLFAGEDAAALRGLRIHANTISHARLVALEDTYPRVRAHLGEGEFNRLSRIFLESSDAGARPLNEIGSDFANWLGDPRVVDLARTEWAWLESYNAAEARALELTDLARFDEAMLLGLHVRLHPAVRIVRLASDAAPLVDPAFLPGTTALLVTRPAADVRVCPIHAAAAAALDIAKEIVPLGNLFVALTEEHPDEGAAIAALINAGAFERF